MKETKGTMLLICDCYGLSTSGGRLVYDLEIEFVRLGFSVKVLHQPRVYVDNKQVAKQTKKVSGNLKRGIDEILLSIVLSFRVLKMRNDNFIGVVSYSPSIFLFMPALIAKFKFGVKYYLITRDIFPQWLLQSGIIKNGALYKLLLFISRLSYLSASYIGLQSKTDKDIVDKLSKRTKVSEVLDNWRTIKPFKRRIRSSDASTGIRLLYAGNVGEAQRLDFVFNYLLGLNKHCSLEIIVYGFGRGMESVKEKLRRHPYSEMIKFYSPVTEEELFEVSNDCDYGLVALDDKLTTGNIPGKILTYLNFQLPILGIARRASELEDLILKENIGIFLSYNDLETDNFKKTAEHIIITISKMDDGNLTRCLQEKFSTKVAANKILSKFVKGLEY